MGTCGVLYYRIKPAATQNLFDNEYSVVSDWYFIENLFKLDNLAEGGESFTDRENTTFIGANQVFPNA